MRALFFLLLSVWLIGCATPAERAAQMQHEVDEMIAVYGPACEKLGYKGDTDHWRDCVLRLSAKDSVERARRFSSFPATTSCFGHRGFFQCTTF